MASDPLADAIARARRHFAGGFPPDQPWERLPGEVGAGEIAENQGSGAMVPTVPGVPTVCNMSDELRDRYDERAAIREYDGGLDRAEAERLARIEYGID
tara:strand:+ start:47402 stop:47698 length:297 start_codon:yes stop_codon:yes gene_type:complete